MILRRVIEHVKAQNWTAVALDFVIVVMGVFIGIQLGNWNAAQADVRLGEDYALRLTRDVRENLDGVEAQIAYYNAVLESLQRADALLRETDSDPRALVVNVYRATEIAYTPPVRATWDQIISSGHLGLLPREAVETGLSQFYAFDTAQDLYHVGMNSHYREIVREIIPLNMQIAMRETCSDERDDMANIVGFMEDCDFDVDPAELEAVAGALKSDPAVAASLHYQYSFAVSATLNLAAVERSLENALAVLAAPAHSRGAFPPPVFRRPAAARRLHHPDCPLPAPGPHP